MINKLKKEHSEIIKALNEAEEFGILTKEGQAKLKSAKAALLEHLKEEDQKFYPVLLREAEQNKKLKEELEIFAKDWGNVSSVAFEIFDKYDKGIIGTSLFLDFETLFMVLDVRIKNEEKILYDEYEKIDQ